MKKVLARSLALTLGLALAGAATAAAARIFPEHPLFQVFTAAESEVGCVVSPQLQERAAARNRLILAELERLEGHPWAGVYRTRGIRPTDLSIAPEAGFTSYHDSGCGTCAHWIGSGGIIAAEASRFELEMEDGLAFPPPDKTPKSCGTLDRTLHLVRWGELSFAVPAWRLEEFCADASDGYTFPFIPFRYLGAASDFDFEKPPRPSGKPDVPREVRHLVLDEPLVAGVATLIEQRLRHDQPGSAKVYDVLYALDAGSRHGIAVGMRFYVEGEIYPGRVESVDADSAHVRMLVAVKEERGPERLVGRRSTTLHPKSPR